MFEEAEVELTGDGVSNRQLRAVDGELAVGEVRRLRGVLAVLGGRPRFQVVNADFFRSCLIVLDAAVQVARRG